MNINVKHGAGQNELIEEAARQNPRGKIPPGTCGHNNNAESLGGGSK